MAAFNVKLIFKVREFFITKKRLKKMGFPFKSI